MFVVAEADMYLTFSTIVARIFGPLFFVVGLSILFNRDFYIKAINDFYNNAALLMFSGVMSFILGVFLVVFNNAVEVTQWPILITILGWLGILKGVVLLWAPNIGARVVAGYSKSNIGIVLLSIFAIAFGITLSYCGFLLVK